MILAPGVEFFEDKHEYWYKGTQLSGVTGLIAKNLGLKMQTGLLDEHREEGLHVHKAIQIWIETGKVESVHPGVLWLIDTYNTKKRQVKLYSEVLVSDLKHYASSVDIVLEETDGALMLYDIKKGVFKRDYVTWQLSIYKYLVEKYTDRRVEHCVCIALKDKEYYPIFTKPIEQVEKLLYD